MSLDYRLHDRLRFKTWVKLVPQHGSDVLGHIEDISPDGLGVEHAHTLPLDSQCHLYFMLPLDGHEHIVQARCRVAGCRPGVQPGHFHIGLAFEAFVSDPRSTRALIEQFIQQATRNPD